MAHHTSLSAFVAVLPATTSLSVPTRSHLQQLRTRSRIFPLRTRKFARFPPSTPTCNTISPAPPPPPPSSPAPLSPLTKIGLAIERTVKVSTNLFPVWVLLGAVLAVYHPPSFVWFRSSFIPPTLALIMLGMSLTLPSDTFSAKLLRQPRQVLVGVLAQYTIMPLLGFLISKAFALSVPLTAGLILVSVCPGGAASNVVCLLGGADVGLSVVLTLASTVLSIALIPTLMAALAGTLIPVNPAALLLSTLQVVLLPLIAGAILKPLVARFMRVVNVILPLVSVVGVTLICAAVVSANAATLFTAAVGARLFAAVATMHALGGLLGFIVASICGLGRDACRTVAIEVMMQNSSLAVSLANLHLGNGITAIPGAVSATLHSVFGSILAGYWRWADSRANSGDKAEIESQ